jgi:hypothetical protein
MVLPAILTSNLRIGHGQYQLGYCGLCPSGFAQHAPTTHDRQRHRSPRERLRLAVPFPPIQPLWRRIWRREMFAKITPNLAASRRYFAGPRKPADDNRAGAMPVRRSVRPSLLCRWHRAENGRLGCSWELEQPDAPSGGSPPPSIILGIYRWASRGCTRRRAARLVLKRQDGCAAVRAMARGLDQELEK